MNKTTDARWRRKAPDAKRLVLGLVIVEREIPDLFTADFWGVYEWWQDWQHWGQKGFPFVGGYYEQPCIWYDVIDDFDRVFSMYQSEQIKKQTHASK